MGDQTTDEQQQPPPQQNSGIQKRPEESGCRYRQRLQQMHHHRRLAQLTPFKDGLCLSCQEFFRRPLNKMGINWHSQSVSTIYQNAHVGCSVCALFCRLMKGKGISADDALGFTLGVDSRERESHWTLHSEFRQQIRPLMGLYIIPYIDRMMSAQIWGPRAEDDDLLLQSTNESAGSKKLALKWHSHCKSFHDQCGTQTPSTRLDWRPTRLLSFTVSKLGSNDKIHLVDGANLPDRAEYVALSHCWGKIEVIKLLVSTEAKLRAGLPFSELPKTFREAITVSQWLGYSHIWIDSLCIMQDSADDWQREAQTMKLVYSNAAITIVAAHAKDSSEGLFVDREPESLIPPIVTCSWNSNATPRHCCVVDSRLTTDDVNYSTLSGRAWTIQERALSPRLLTFTKSQMFYQCLQEQYCESWPCSEAPGQLMTDMDQLRSTKVSTERAWITIADAYSRSDLTYEGDKIIALAGIAEAMAERLEGSEYVAGLWKSRMPMELLWSLRQATRPRPSPLIAPTWSWLSTNGSVTVRTTTRPQDIRRLLTTVVDIEVDLVDPSYPTGNFHPGATLQLRGRLKRARWNLIQRYSPSDFRKYQVTFDKLESGTDALDLDFFTSVDVAPGLELASLEIFLLPVAVMAKQSGEYDAIEGLVLTPLDLDAELYERVAHFSFTGKQASYLFLELSLENTASTSPSEPHTQNALDPDGTVEGFTFDGDTRWCRIQEKDIVLV